MYYCIWYGFSILSPSYTLRPQLDVQLDTNDIRATDALAACSQTEVQQWLCVLFKWTGCSLYWYQRVSYSSCCFLPSTIKISLFQPHVSICLSGKVLEGHRIFLCNHFDALCAFNTIRKWDIFGWLVPHTDRWLIKMIWLGPWCTVMHCGALWCTVMHCDAVSKRQPTNAMCDVQYAMCCNLQCAAICNNV